jgi:hypothetical protein
VSHGIDNSTYRGKLSLKRAPLLRGSNQSAKNNNLGFGGGKRREYNKTLLVLHAIDREGMTDVYGDLNIVGTHGEVGSKPKLDTANPRRYSQRKVGIEKHGSRGNSQRP